MKTYPLLAMLFLMLSCGGNPDPDVDDSPQVDVDYSEAVLETTPDSGPESFVSGELPFEYLSQDDFEAVTGCSVMLMPEDNPDYFVFGFNYPEGVGEGNFDGRHRTLPFVSKGENADGDTVYTHGNDEYEAVTRISSEIEQSGEVTGVSGVVTVRRKSDSQAMTFKVLGKREC